MAKINHAKTFDDLPRPRHSAVMDEMKDGKQTDRAVAITGAAYVDLVLRAAISATLLPDDKLMAELFENRGPLQDFGSRINVAFALRLCGRAAYHDLRTIKDIRNAFAHSAEKIDFHRDDLKRLCETLRYPKIARSNRPNPKTPRQQYVMAIEILTELFFGDLVPPKNGERDPLIMKEVE